MTDSAVVIRASVRSARRPGHQLSATGRRVQPILLDEFAHLAPVSTRTVRAFAPHKSGRLERGIRASVRSYGGRITLEVESTARDQETGYDYLPVTRFGHRVPIIYPVHAKALRIPLAGGVIYRKWVRGYKPARDWVADAFDALQRELDEAADRIGRAIDRSLRT